MLFIDRIKDYNKGLHLENKGITPNSPPEDVIKACVDKAFSDSIMNSAGRIWGILNYTDEVSEVKKLVADEVYKYLTSNPDEYSLDKIHRYLVHTIVEKCFKQYNADRENATSGRKVGYTVGNAQKVIDMTLKDVMSHYVTIGNTQYDKHFKSCHIPFDSIIYGYIKETVIPDLIQRQSTAAADLFRKIIKTPWSLNQDYELYRDAQGSLRLYLKTTEKYADCTPLNAEFDIWATLSAKQ